MSYISSQSTREQFLETIYNKSRSESSRELAKAAIGQFDLFCKDVFKKESSDEVLKDIKKDLEQDYSSDKIMIVLSKFVIWLGEDHPHLLKRTGHKNSPPKPITARMPSTIKSYFGIVRDYVEDVGGIELNDRKIRRKIKLPTIVEEEDPEPFTHEELKLFLDNATPDKRLLYMVLKDSGMRIGETCQLRKRDFDVEKDPVEIHIPAKITKGKKARITFVTFETKPALVHKLKKLSPDDLVFGSQENKRFAAENERSNFNYLRSKIGIIEPRVLDKYEYNNRYKKNIHSLRSFTATQAEEVHGEDYAHGLIGHKKYLNQYIRNKKKLPVLYKKLESKLLIYEKVELLESNDTVSKEEFEELKREMRLIRKYGKIIPNDS